MNLAVGCALVTLCAALAMAMYLLARRHKEPLHWMLLGYLAGLGLWTGGVIARFTVASEAELAVALRLVFTGVLIASSFWLLTAMAYLGGRAAPWHHPAFVRRSRVVAVRARAVHQRRTSPLPRQDRLRDGDGRAALHGGPLFWAYLAWAYGCVGAGMALYLRTARAMLRGAARRRGILLAISSAVPAAISTLYVFQLAPLHYDLTPVGLLIAMILLSLAIFRYQLLESLPLAREVVLAHLDDGVVMASAGGRITEWNPAAARIMGEAALARGADLGDALARLGLIGPHGAGRTRTPDGRLIEVITAIVDQGRGELAGRFAILSDRSAIDRAEGLARQTQRLEMVGASPARSRRRSTIRSRTCARAWSRSSDWAASTRRARGRRARRRAGRSAQRGARDARRRRADPPDRRRHARALERGARGAAPVDLNEVAREALRIAQLGEAATDGPVIGLSFTLPPVRGNADPARAGVVLNLVVNARQALADRPRARSRSDARERQRRRARSARQRAQIAEAVLDRVFDPFFTTRGPDGGRARARDRLRHRARARRHARVTSSARGGRALRAKASARSRARLPQTGAGRM